MMVSLPALIATDRDAAILYNNLLGKNHQLKTYPYIPKRDILLWILIYEVLFNLLAFVNLFSSSFFL